MNKNTNPFLSYLSKSIIALGTSMLAVEAADKAGHETLADLSVSGCNKLARSSGIPAAHLQGVSDKARVAIKTLESLPSVVAAMSSSVTIENASNAALIKQYRAAMKLACAAARVRPAIVATEAAA